MASLLPARIHIIPQKCTFPCAIHSSSRFIFPSTSTSLSSNCSIQLLHPTAPSITLTMSNSTSFQLAFQPPSSLISRSHPGITSSSFCPHTVIAQPCSQRKRAPTMSAFRIVPQSPDHQDRSEEIHIASGRALTPMRRPADNHTRQNYTEQQPLPSQRRTDIMAPQSGGFWWFLPYSAATAVIMALAWVGNKRFTARQKDLVEEFGQVIVMYGTSPESKREITTEYKRKIGPALLRGAMFASYLRVLLAEKPIVPSTIQDVAIVKKLLRLDDNRAVKTINTLGASMQDTPSLLGKLLFVSERIVTPDHITKLALVPLLPYSSSTVSDLQQNMLERCYRDYVNLQIDIHSIDQPPEEACAALRLDPQDAKELFDGVLLARLKQREREAAEEAAAAAEEASKPNIPELDYTARSGEPAKAAVHAYQCSDCGFTLFPAAGREFKFYGDDFVCPTCGAPKDKFVDVNSE